MAEILTPDQVNLYRNMPESAQDLCRDLIATIDALAEALRAEFFRAEEYHSHLAELCRQAPGCIGQEEIADNARARVAAWLE